jgi:N-methylhydantoinase B
VFGGEPGKTGGCAVIRTDGSRQSLRSKAAVDLHEGDVVEMVVGGGGGYGHPTQRSDALIDRDLDDGILTRDPRAARRLAAE